jgi:protein phosphatase
MIQDSAGITDPGCVRPSNQDRILLDDTLGLYAVCDGVGGRRGGSVAAELAVQVIRQYIEASQDPKDVTWPYGYNLAMSFGGNRLVTAVKLANRQVWRRSEESIEFLGMGTTISAVLIEGSAVVAVNIGDSRAYLFRDGGLIQMTIDDTAGGAPAGTADAPPQPALHPAIHGVLTRAAGSREDAEVHLKQCPLENGDAMLLCSDGLHGCVSVEAMATILKSAKNAAAAAGSLVEAAKQAGAPDNVSALVVRWGG